MAETPESRAVIELSPEDVFKPTRGDAVHSGVKAALGTLPVFGGVAAEIFAAFIAAPSAKRLENFLNYVGDALRLLETKVDGFNIEALSENETFQTTMIQASQAAMRTHSKEKHEALRNAVLNASLPQAPDDMKQEMFLQLCDELMPLHLSILVLFDRDDIPMFMLGALDREKSLGHLEEFCKWLENSLSELRGNYIWYIRAVDDLHKKSLISNNSLDRGEKSEWQSSPKITPLAKEFLAFIKSPFDHE